MDIQKMLDAYMGALRTTRSQYQTTLGELIDELAKREPSRPVIIAGVGAPGILSSYRGYYSDLAFEGGGPEATVSDVLANCRAALGATFEGYKGGDYVMGPDTPLWASPYGESSGIAIMGVCDIEGAVVLMTKQVD